MTRAAKRIVRSLSVLTLMACGCTAGASTPPDERVGQIKLALTAIAGSTTYALVNASFVVSRDLPPPASGDNSELRLNATDPIAGDLSADLPVGRYTVKVLDGWQLDRVDSATTLVPVRATLQSRNPLTVSVFSARTTVVSFEFQTTGIPLHFGSGSIDAGIGVAMCDPMRPDGGACDKTDPVIVITGVSEGQITNALSVAPVFTATDEHLTSVTATLDGAPFESGNPVATEGEHRLEVVATDAAGNRSTRALSFTIDRTAPLLVVTRPTEGERVAALSLVVSGTIDGASAEVMVNGVDAPVTQGAFSQRVTLTPGANTIVVLARDNAGNVAESTIHVRANTQPPTLTLSTPIDGTRTTDASVQVSGVARPVDSQTGVAVTVGGVSAAVSAAGEFSQSVALTAGDNVIAVAAVDDYGLRTEASLTITRSSVPVSVSSIAAGAYHNCAQLSNGAVACWGLNGSEQLGNGTSPSSPTDHSVAPVLVQGISSATALAAGSTYSCALLADASVSCWGFGVRGQLGNGSEPTYSLPVAVLDVSGATAISAGYNHACALVTGGQAKCWGFNQKGQIGNGADLTNPMDVPTPVAVSGLTASKSIVGGQNHTCAVLVDSSVACWGWNDYGQLGNGSTTSSSLPVAVTGLTGVQAVALGGQHSCALLNDGSVKCWGYNSNAQLGTGAGGASVLQPGAAVVGLLGPAVAITLGNGDSCALVTPPAPAAPVVQCWGYLPPTAYTSPTVIPGLAQLGVPTQVTAGDFHACALLADRSVACWGQNTYGQLGDGTTTDSASATRVAGLPPM